MTTNVLEIPRKQEATIEDLYKIEEKAEIVNGEIVILMATGGDPGFAGDAIFVSLFNYSKQNRFGRAVGDNKAFAVNLKHRKSFSPDAAFYVGENPGMKFYEGAPIFAVEVRSENDYGKSAEKAMAKKRADYFEAGTLVVWDVDLLSDDVIKSYTSDNPTEPKIFHRNEIANAEPAVPNWTIQVNDLFDEQTSNL
jgi:Uma2 family endonuclease